MESVYDDPSVVAGQVKAGQHREVIGGLWDQMGQLQLDFMQARGLQPAQQFLDLGCGSLRGGVQFVRYLQPGHYYGLDNNQSLLDAGYDVELATAGLQGRLPRENLFCNPNFELPVADGFFDAGIAQFDLQLVLADEYDETGAPAGISASFSYASDLFDKDTVEQFAQRYVRLLAAVVEKPDKPVGDIELLDVDERAAVLVEWNDTAHPVDTSCTLVDLFDEQVAVSGSAVAVVALVGVGMSASEFSSWTQPDPAVDYVAGDPAWAHVSGR